MSAPRRSHDGAKGPEVWEKSEDDAMQFSGQTFEVANLGRCGIHFSAGRGTTENDHCTDIEGDVFCGKCWTFRW